MKPFVTVVLACCTLASFYALGAAVRAAARRVADRRPATDAVVAIIVAVLALVTFGTLTAWTAAS